METNDDVNSHFFMTPEAQKILNEYNDFIEKHKLTCYNIYYYKETGIFRWCWISAEKISDLQSYIGKDNALNIDLGEAALIAEDIPLVDIVSEKLIKDFIHEIAKSDGRIYLCDIYTANDKLINLIRSANRSFDLRYGVSQIENILGNLNSFEIAFAIQWWKSNETLIDMKISTLVEAKQSVMEYPINPQGWSAPHWKWFVESIKSIDNYTLYIEHIIGDYLQDELKYSNIYDDSLVGRTVEVPVQNGKLIKGIVISEGYDGRILVQCCDGEQWTGLDHQVNVINK